MVGDGELSIIDEVFLIEGTLNFLLSAFSGTRVRSHIISAVACDIQRVQIVGMGRRIDGQIVASPATTCHWISKDDVEEVDYPIPSEQKEDSDLKLTG